MTIGYRVLEEKSMQTVKFRGMVLSLVAVIISSCDSGPSTPPELVQAAALVEHFTTPSVLERSTFPVVIPHGTPKQFVSWLFSQIGTAEWPLTKEQSMRELGDAYVPGIPTLPDGVSYFHTKPDSARGRQIVVKWDDARGVVIVEGYLDPKQPPMLIKEYVLPKVTSTNELARITAQSNIEMGASFQAF